MKFLALRFETKNEEVYMDIYFQNLPLPRFYPKLGNCIKNLFQLMYNFTTDTANGELKLTYICRYRTKLFLDWTKFLETASETRDKNLHGNAEILSLYKDISAVRQCSLNYDENVQHPYLKPKLRPYQELAVRWMLHRERMTDNEKGKNKCL